MTLLTSNWENRILELLHSLFIVAAFILMSHSVELYHVWYVASVRHMYGVLSKVCTIVALVMFLLSWKKIPKSLFFAFGMVYSILLLSTIFHDGDVRRSLAAAYPVMGMCAFVAAECSTVQGTRRLLRTLTDLFLVLVGVNLLLMLYKQDLFGKTALNNGFIYFLGGENQIGYSLMPGFFVALMNQRVNQQRWKLWLYSALFWITTIFNFSAGSMMGALVILVYFLIPVIRRAFEKWHLGVFAAMVAFFCVVLVYMSDVLVSIPPLRYVVQEVLGKNLTFSGRTDIWDVVKQALVENPIWGYGVQETGRVFKITVWREIRYVSAHNQYLQYWYEGGVFTVVALAAVLLLSGTLLKKAPDCRIAADTKAFTVGVMVMLLSEAATYDALFFILNLGVMVSLMLKREDLAAETAQVEPPA